MWFGERIAFGRDVAKGFCRDVEPCPSGRLVSATLLVQIEGTLSAQNTLSFAGKPIIHRGSHQAAAAAKPATERSGDPGS